MTQTPPHLLQTHCQAPTTRPNAHFHHKDTLLQLPQPPGHRTYSSQPASHHTPPSNTDSTTTATQPSTGQSPSKHALHTPRLWDMHRHCRMVHIPTNHHHSNISPTYSTHRPRKLGMDSASLPHHVLCLPLCSSALDNFWHYNNRQVCKRLCDESMTLHSATIHLPSPLS